MSATESTTARPQAATPTFREDLHEVALAVSNLWWEHRPVLVRNGRLHERIGDARYEGIVSGKRAVVGELVDLFVEQANTLIELKGKS